MKKLLTTLSILSLSALLAVGTSAQTVYKSTGGKSKNRLKGQSKFDTHKLVVGGNLGFNGGSVDDNTTYSFFSITPSAGYYLSDFDIAGISLGYQYSRYKFKNYYNYVTGNTYDYKLVLPMYYFGVYNHLFVIPQLFLNTELLYTYYKYTDFNYNIRTGEYDRYTELAPSVILGLGYASRQSADTKFWYAMSINYDILQHNNSPYYSGSDFFAGLFYKFGYYVRL